MRSLAPPKCILGEVSNSSTPICCKNFKFWQIGRNVVPFVTRIIKATWGTKLTQLLLKIAKLLSRGLRPIFGGGVRNNCNTICTWNVLWMINMLTIVLARVCDLPRQGRVSMCMNQWWHIHIAFTHITTWIQGTLLQREFHTCVHTRCNTARQSDPWGVNTAHKFFQIERLIP